MRRILLVGTFLLFAGIAFSQAENTSFTLGIYMPTATDEVGDVQLKNLQNKISLIINNSKQAMVGYYNDLIVYPVITVGESQVVEGGLQNITVTTIDLTLKVAQVSTNVVFNTMERKLKGSGSDKAQSINDAISKLNTTDFVYAEFIALAKEKILKYYEDNCSGAISSANSMAAKGQYEEAISMLESIPGGVSCHDQAEKKAVELFKKYEKLNCAKYISEAKAQVAVNNYDGALEILQMIDATSTCGKEKDQVIAQISKKVDKAIQREYDMEKAYLNAIKEIAKAYFTSKGGSGSSRKK